MPARNSTKEYIADAYYHLYNRGVEKRKIFLDKQDSAVFLSYIKEYLLPKDEKALREQLDAEDTTPQQKDKVLKLLRLNNFSETISLLAYCLMPNHFHLFVKQKGAASIDTFMNSLATRYALFFNKKYKRVGHLYQGVYKAVRIVTEEQFLHLSRYIHRQALDLQGVPLQEKFPCSYAEYTGMRSTEWVNAREVLSYFSETNEGLSYPDFIKQEGYSRVLDGITIEEDDE